MNAKIKSSTGRIALISFTISGMLFGGVVIVLRGSGGSLVSPAMTEALKLLVQFYLPMLAVITAFYFSESGKMKSTENSESTDFEIFFVTIVLVALWAFLPPISLIINDTYQSAFELTKNLKGYGDAIGVGALAYYFSQTSKIPNLQK